MKQSRSAMDDAALATFVRRMMLEDIRAGLAAPTGLDLDAIHRSRVAPVSAIRPFVICCRRSRGMDRRSCRSAFCRRSPRTWQRAARSRGCAYRSRPGFISFAGKVRHERQIVDPLAAQLTELAAALHGRSGQRCARRSSALEKVFSADLASNAAFRAALESAYARLAKVDGPATLGEALSSINA